MLSTMQLSELIAPVVSRAHAGMVGRAQTFTDRTASFVLERLGITETNSWWIKKTQNHILTCAWIDVQTTLFFTSHPKGEGIEIDSGLSTRFHRISERLEWPQFSWVMVNTPDINDCVQFIFQNLDNHRCIAQEHPQTDWYKTVQWHLPTPKLLIIGELNPIQDWTSFTALYDIINQALTPQCPQIDLVIHHQIETFTAHCCNNKDRNKSITIFSEKNNANKRSNIFSRFISLFIAPSRPQNLHHIRITKQF